MSAILSLLVLIVSVCTGYFASEHFRYNYSHKVSNPGLWVILTFIVVMFLTQVVLNTALMYI